MHIIKASGRIALSSDGLDTMVKGSCGQTFTAFEDHVFEEVRESAACEVFLVLAPGFNPALRGDDLGGMVFLQDDGEPVWQGVQGGVGGGELHLEGCGERGAGYWDGREGGQAGWLLSADGER